MTMRGAKLKLADAVRQKVAARTPFQTQSQPQRRAGEAGLRRSALQQASHQPEANFQTNRSAAKGLAALANNKLPQAVTKQPVVQRGEAPQTRQPQPQTQPQAVRVPDRGREPVAPKKTVKSNAKGKAKLAQDPKKAVKQAAKPEVKPEVKQVVQAGTAAVAQAKGHAGDKGKAKVAEKKDADRKEKKGAKSSLTKNVGKAQAHSLGQLCGGMGAGVGSESGEWQPSENSAVAATQESKDKEDVSRYEFPQGAVVDNFNEPGPLDDVRKEAKKFQLNVLRPKVANAARVNDKVTEQLEKVALSDKVIANDPEVKALMRKCMNGKRFSAGGGGMHA
jgi:hypothetical protein